MFLGRCLRKILPRRVVLHLLKKEGLVLGKDCEILNGYDFGSEPYLVSIGDNVRISDGVRITTHDGAVWVLRHLYPDCTNADRFGRVKIGDNCHIGMNAMILPGVTIGKNCIVGAGAIVTHDVPDGAIVAGIPARVIGNIEGYYEKHRGEMLATKRMSWDEKRQFVQDTISNNSSTF